jgi:hypothetical protein
MLDEVRVARHLPRHTGAYLLFLRTVVWARDGPAAFAPMTKLRLRHKRCLGARPVASVPGKPGEAL